MRATRPRAVACSLRGDSALGRCSKRRPRRAPRSSPLQPRGTPKHPCLPGTTPAGTVGVEERGRRTKASQHHHRLGRCVVPRHTYATFAPKHHPVSLRYHEHRIHIHGRTCPDARVADGGSLLFALGSDKSRPNALNTEDDVPPLACGSRFSWLIILSYVQRAAGSRLAPVCARSPSILFLFHRIGKACFLCLHAH